jgi:hypothetical protein
VRSVKRRIFWVRSVKGRYLFDTVHTQNPPSQGRRATNPPQESLLLLQNLVCINRALSL